MRLAFLLALATLFPGCTTTGHQEKDAPCVCEASEEETARAIRRAYGDDHHAR